MKAGTEKGQIAAKRKRMHQQEAPGVGRIRYTELGMPWLGKGKRCARVVPGETLNLAAFIRRLCERNPGLAPTTAHFYLETAFAELAECLREGRFVTFEGIAHFGVSIKGTLTTDERQVNKTHALRPWARFLTPFADAVNDGAYPAPVAPLPAHVAFKHAAAPRRRIIAAGEFRSPEEVDFRLQPADGATAIPCELFDADTSATRHECSRLYLRATAEFPAATLLARWFTPTGEALEAKYPLPS